MREDNKQLNSNRLVLNSQAAFSVLLFVVWTRYTFCAYIIAIAKGLPVIWHFADYIYPLAIVILITVAFSYMRKQFGLSEIVIYLSVILAMLFSIILYPVNEKYIQREAQEILTAIVPMIFLGVCYDHEKHGKALYWTSIISIASRLLFQMYSASLGNEMHYDSMGTAYRMLPSTMYLIYWAFHNMTIKNWLIAAFTILMMFIYGTRGPILCIVTYFCGGYLYVTLKDKTWVGIFFQLLVVFVTVYLVFSNAINDIAEWLQSIFAEWGLSTRVFDFFLEGNIADNSGRDVITEYMKEAINHNPLFGYGLMGDRAILRGAYAHNLFWELWCHYGIFAGTALIVAIIVLIINALKRQRGNPAGMLFMLMLICMVIVKLWVSNSYIREEYFFFMIGVMISEIRKKKQRQPEDMRGVQTP